MDVRPRLRCVASWVGVLVLVGGLIACGDAREHVLVPDGSPMFTIMNFIEPLSLDPLPDGWYHRRFWRHGPMDISFATKEGTPAIRLATSDTASMLFRHVDVPLDGYPILSWRWFIEKGIDMDVTDTAKSWLANKGFDRLFGATPLRRVIQDNVEDKLSDAILAGELGPGSTALIDVEDEDIVVRSKSPLTVTPA